ncbi:MAG: hypothetical protein CME62_11445 [Halobacteriovoraceae bacterium]|nr:hypothetical protein [Halobacteriovoraceae bacterium]|tara:strand:+ start:14698 stop:15282 length:585 start_codon:yes stop_codon:yes gene_type:complete
MNNQRGAINLVAICLLMLVSSLGILVLKQRIHHVKLIQAKQHLLLCSKELNGETNNLVRMMNKTNPMLKALTLAKYGSLIIPGIGQVTHKSAKIALKSIKQFQQLKFISYLKNLYLIRKKKCPLSVLSFKTPYRTKVSQALLRDKFNRTVLREKKWKQVLKNKNWLIKTFYQSNGTSTSQLRSRDNLLSHYFSL